MPLTHSSEGLAALEHRVAHDLACLNYPPENWLPAKTGPDGRPMTDILVVGAGMRGQATAFALLREGLRNIRVIDRNAPGSEGPWGTFARMPTLRSPKQVNGPDLGIPSLTFRAWFEAQHGERAWDDLYKIDRLDWRDYLLWIRKAAGIPVENGVRARTVVPASDYVRVELEQDGRSSVSYARRVVLALGREGSGGPRFPAFPSCSRQEAESNPRVFHSSDAIDFRALAGKDIAILGAGASAFDNAGTALEAGARAVTMYARRPHLPQVNKSKWASFPGFLHGYADMDDDMRWRMYTYILEEQAPPPHESVLRCERHAGFQLELGTAWDDMRPGADGVEVTSSRWGARRYDSVILATGFDVDIVDRPELSGISGAIDLWRNHVPPQAARRNREAARFPYLSPAFELQEASAGSTPGLDRIHLFNWGSTMSQGGLAGDIPGLSIGAARLSDAIVRRLFTEEATAYYDAMREFEDPELAPTSFFVPRDQRITRR